MINAARRLVAATVVASFAVMSGCATWDCRFNPKTTMWFINDLNDVVKVDFADETRETTLYRQDGTSFKYKSSAKVRVTFPSGYRFVAYDVPSPNSKLYRSDDGEWELLAAGIVCRVYQYFDDGSEIVFEGLLYSQDKGGMSKGKRTGGQRVFNSPREHTDTHTRPNRGSKK